MNNYIIVYVGIHVFVLFILGLNIFFQYRRQTRVKLDSVIRDDNWFRTMARTRTFLFLSVRNFLTAFIAEGLSFWLLWMGGLFDK